MLLAAIGLLPARAAPTLHYTARLHGLPLLDISYCLDLRATSYSAHLVAHTLGLADFLVHGRVDGRATGTVSGITVQPATYTETGRISGEDFTLAMAFPVGESAITTTSPPPTKYRTPVPPSQLHGSIDGLSAIALETLVVGRTHACQGSVLIYDARQLRRLTTRSPGTEPLAASPRSIFAGPALRCDTQSLLIAGFLKNQSQTMQAKPHASSAWLAVLAPPGPAMPVRFTFDADFLGQITVDLDRAAQPPGPCP